MKLLEKIKDLFMDDVVEDDEIELEEEEKQEYKEPVSDVLPKVMRDNIKEEENIELKVKTDSYVTSKVNEQEKEPSMPQKKFIFPMEFDNEIPNKKNNRDVNINVLDIEKEKNKNSKRIAELYSKKEDVKEKAKFKASPVISPVYGILDKNYSKDEVKERTDDISVMKRPSKKVDFETVRKKAFGNLADEINDNMMCENCVLYQEAKKNNTLNEDDLLYDMTIEKNADISIEKAYDDYEEFGVAYEPIGRHETNSKDSIVINNNIENNQDAVEESVKEELQEESKVNVDDDFFKLIDSMYKERSDE